MFVPADAEIDLPEYTITSEIVNKDRCSTVQFSTVQYSTVQYSTVQYSTVQYSTM